jgi:hypothetical protein
LLRINVLYLLLVSAGIPFAASQSVTSSRVPGQVSIEDSTRVYWTRYPFPFSRSTISNSDSTLVTSELTFFCDLPGTIELGLLDKNDSIVCKGNAPLNRLPYSGLRYWLGGPDMDAGNLQKGFYRADTNSWISVVIIVEGRWKSIIRHSFYTSKGWYYWFENSHPR